MAVEDITIENVVNAGYVFGAQKNRKQKIVVLRRERLRWQHWREIEVQGKYLQALRGPCGMLRLEIDPVFFEQL